MIDLQNPFISTYSRALLSDWNVIRDMMIMESKRIKDVMQADTETDPLFETQINNQQINDALNGPFQHFFKAHLRVYATITKIESALTIKKEDLFKESEHLSDSIFGLSVNFLEKIELSTLKQLREQCNALTIQHHADWKKHIQNWGETLLAEFKKNNLGLSDIERQDFMTNQTISELNDRFVDLTVSPPTLSKYPVDFNQYFILKGALTIQSALARMQQSHTEKEIDMQLKKMSSVFKTIGKIEKGLLEGQKKALTELVKPLKKD